MFVTYHYLTFGFYNIGGETMEILILGVIGGFIGVLFLVLFSQQDNNYYISPRKNIRYGLGKDEIDYYKLIKKYYRKQHDMRNRKSKL